MKTSQLTHRVALLVLVELRLSLLAAEVLRVAAHQVLNINNSDNMKRLMTSR